MLSSLVCVFGRLAPGVRRHVSHNLSSIICVKVCLALRCFTLGYFCVEFSSVRTYGGGTIVVGRVSIGFTTLWYDTYSFGPTVCGGG